MLYYTYSMNEFVLSAVDERMLLFVGRYHYVTAEQMKRAMGYAMLNYTQSRLKRLNDAGYFRTNFSKRGSQSGSVPFIYSLSEKGWKVLEGAGVTFDQKKRPGAEKVYSVVFYEHMLGVVDVLIGFDLLERSRDEVVIDELRNELDIQRQVRTYNQQHKTHFVEWDSFIDLTVADYKAPIALEYDRYTEDRKKWSAKIRRTVELLEAGYEPLFGQKSVTIAVILGTSEFSSVTPTKRRDQLRRWTANELARSGKERWEELFLFTDQPAVMASGEDARMFFGGTHWYTPTSDTPTALLDMP